MAARVVTIRREFASWREAARGLLAEGVAPGDVLWEDEGAGQPLLAGLGERATRGVATTAATVNVPKEFVGLAEVVACHREPDRWGLLYEVLWRLTHGERHLLEISVDDDVQALARMERQVRFDRHKMTAFVRFREVAGDDGPHYVAWYRPDHHIVRLAAPFFANRFTAMRWSILTRDECAHWDGRAVTFSPGIEADPRHADEVEGLWKAYYASTFNPARVRTRAMKKEMPVRFWENLPEAELIPDLLREAPKRVELMVKNQPTECAGAGRFLPADRSIAALREAARVCRGCDLCGPATQTVFGEGPESATAMMIGEQPGDTEDLEGRPFVGPAGQLLDEVLSEVGLDRSTMYVTNTVKHFKFEQRGKRRVHAKPSSRDITACLPWAMAEIEAVRPRAILCLGVTPAQALLGRHFRMTTGRGIVYNDTRYAPWLMATYHPSALLRIPDEAVRQSAREQFAADLRMFRDRVIAGGA